MDAHQGSKSTQEEKKTPRRVLTDNSWCRHIPKLDFTQISIAVIRANGLASPSVHVHIQRGIDQNASVSCAVLFTRGDYEWSPINLAGMNRIAVARVSTLCCGHVLTGLVDCNRHGYYDISS